MNKPPSETVCDAFQQPVEITHFDPNVAPHFKLSEEERSRLQQRLENRPPLERIADALERNNELLSQLIALQTKGN